MQNVPILLTKLQALCGFSVLFFCLSLNLDQLFLWWCQSRLNIACIVSLALTVFIIAFCVIWNVNDSWLRDCSSADVEIDCLANGSDEWLLYTFHINFWATSESGSWDFHCWEACWCSLCAASQVFYSTPHFGSKLADMPWGIGYVLRPAPTVSIFWLLDPFPNIDPFEFSAVYFQSFQVENFVWIFNNNELHLRRNEWQCR